MPTNTADLKCASSLEKTFLYEEVFGGSYFDEGVELPPAPTDDGRPQKTFNIIDVGANIGLFALYCLENTQGHIGRLITIEPVKETYDLLLHNLDVFYDHNDTYLDVIPLRTGLTEKRKKTSDEFYVFPRALGWSGRCEGVDREAIKRDLKTFISTSLDDPSARGLDLPRFVRTLAVLFKNYIPFLYGLLVTLATWVLMSGAKKVRCPTSTLSEVVDAYIEDGETVGLLKIDVEGGELGVLKGMEARHWGLVDRLVVEVHLRNLGDVLQCIDAKGGFENVVAKQTDELQGTSLWMVYASRG